MITDEEWAAIVANDKTYDSIFRYAVKTTRIFCRPSCSSRLPKKENIHIYYDLLAPERDGYRPCKRCQPTDEKIGNLIWVESIKTIIEENYHLDLTLSELASLARGSESNLRHVFKKETGMTPHQYLMSVRMKEAEKKLMTTNQSINQIAQHVGLPNTSYFISKFRQTYGTSPKQYRKK